MRCKRPLCDRVQLHGRDKRRIVGEAEFGEILALQMQPDCLTDVRRYFVERVPFGDDGEIQTLRDNFFSPRKMRTWIVLRFILPV